MTYTVHPRAEQDIEDITLHIAGDNPLAADRWFEGIYRLCGRLGETPGMGVERPKLGPQVRMFPYGKYCVFYRTRKSGVIILRVIHGARRWKRLF